MNKITSTKVIELLMNGWELGLTKSMLPSAWMERQLGSGGEIHHVEMGAFKSLLRCGKIRRVEEDHLRIRYELT